MELINLQDISWISACMLQVYLGLKLQKWKVDHIKVPLRIIRYG